jgi:hypothetical protein
MQATLHTSVPSGIVGLHLSIMKLNLSPRLIAHVGHKKVALHMKALR